MLKRLFSRHRESSIRPHKAVFEQVEPRVLMHSPTFSSVSGDNRGEMFITVEASSRAEVDASSISSAAIQMFTTGPDGVTGTTDDVRVHAALNYNASIGRITVRGTIPADHTYRVRVVASRFTASGGAFALDGEFHGAQTQTGNGVAGGNFDITIKRDTGNAPTARWSTSAGTMNVSLFKSQTPKNVSNFLAYVNTGRYDNMAFSRSIAGFVIQGGSMKVDANGNAVANPAFQKGSPPHDVTVQGEPGISNTRGRLSMALSTGPNSGSNQFFFNIGDNSASLDGSGNGGPFTAFGQCRGANDLATMDAINNKATAALRNGVTGHGVLPNIASTGLTDVPVNQNATFTTIGPEQTETGESKLIVTGGFSATRDLVIVRRIAVLSRIFAT